MPYYPPGKWTTPVTGREEDVQKLLESFMDEVRREFEKVAESQAELGELELRHSGAAPLKPREGMIVAANGTTWNPGAGAGAYEYKGGAWVKL